MTTGASRSPSRTTREATTCTSPDGPVSIAAEDLLALAAWLDPRDDHGGRLIDDDPGRGGQSIEGRPGFQRLIAEVAPDRVGLILGLEMSRPARSCRDWHHLLELELSDSPHLIYEIQVGRFYDAVARPEAVEGTTTVAISKQERDEEDRRQTRRQRQGRPGLLSQLRTGRIGCAMAGPRG